MLLNLIETFLATQIERHPQLQDGPLAFWTPEHETQILIDTNGLEECYGSGLDNPPTHWIDEDGYQHRNIRIPFGAMTDNPTFQDRKVIGPIHERWQLIGTTGWNWEQNKSMWVGFDFDSIDGHEHNSLTPKELDEIKHRALELPYVRARTSKGGKGIHLLVYLEPWVSTRNHSVHAALAKDVLARMSKDCDFNFEAAADGCGGILWHWTRGLKSEGLQNIRLGQLATASK